MRVGLSIYGTTFSMGMEPTSGRNRMKPVELIDQALAMGLEGVELPISLLVDMSNDNWSPVWRTLSNCSLD